MPALGSLEHLDSCSSFLAPNSENINYISYLWPNIYHFRLFENCWTDEEVKVATGNAGCHLLVHPLKLASAYATVKVIRFYSFKTLQCRPRLFRRKTFSV